MSKLAPVREWRVANQRQAIDARMKQFHGAGTVRSAAPGTTFTLADHPEHDRDEAEQRHFLITAITHRARNNLGAAITGSDAQQEVPLGDNDPAGNPTVNRKKSPKSKTAEAGEDSEDSTNDLFYRNELTTIRSPIPWRPLMADAHGRHIHPRPTIRGNLIAGGRKICFFRIAGLVLCGLVMLLVFRRAGDTSGD